MELLPYQRNPNWRWEQWMALTLAAGVRSGWGLLGIVVIALVGIAITIIYILLTRLWRIYQKRAFSQLQRPVRRVLWGALAGVLVLLGISYLLISYTRFDEWAVYLGAWSVAIYLLLVEWCEWYEGKAEHNAAQQLPQNEVSIADLLDFSKQP